MFVCYSINTYYSGLDYLFLLTSINSYKQLFILLIGGG